MVISNYIQFEIFQKDKKKNNKSLSFGGIEPTT